MHDSVRAHSGIVPADARSDGRGSGASRHRVWGADRLTDHLFVLPAVLFFLLVQVYPLVYNVLLSFKRVDVYTFRTGGEWAGLANYVWLLHDPTFWVALGNSALFTGVCTLAHFVLGFGLALLFQRPFPGAALLRSLILMAWIVPTVVVGTLFKWLLSDNYGIVNQLLAGLGLVGRSQPWLADPSTAMWGVILADIWHGLPFWMLLLFAGLQTLPADVYEAARIDGASGWQSFSQITLPLMRPTILVVMLLGLIYTFRVFDLFYVMTQGGPVNATTVLPFYTYTLSFTSFEFGKGSALSGLMLLMLAAVAFLYLRAIQHEEHG